LERTDYSLERLRPPPLLRKGKVLPGTSTFNDSAGHCSSSQDQCPTSSISSSQGVSPKTPFEHPFPPPGAAQEPTRQPTQTTLTPCSELASPTTFRLPTVSPASWSIVHDHEDQPQEIGFGIELVTASSIPGNGVLVLFPRLHRRRRLDRCPAPTRGSLSQIPLLLPIQRRNCGRGGHRCGS